MRDVVETLQPEQNEAMRAPAGVNTLIQRLALVAERELHPLLQF